MKNTSSLELSVGIFMVIGIVCLAYLSISLGRIVAFGTSGYDVTAVFSDIGGLREGASVQIAGVGVGHVHSIRLQDYEAGLVLRINRGVDLHSDAIVSIRTSGLIGEKYVQISAGASDEVVKPGGRIRQTEAAVDIEALIGKYAFGHL